MNVTEANAVSALLRYMLGIGTVDRAKALDSAEYLAGRANATLKAGIIRKQVSESWLADGDALDPVKLAWKVSLVTAHRDELLSDARATLAAVYAWQEGDALPEDALNTIRGLFTGAAKQAERGGE